MHTLNLRSFLWFTTGVALTLTTIAVFSTLRASAAVTPGESTFVPITPCRLFDTRPAPDNVGTRTSPVGQTPFVAQVTGTNGKCTIPSDATAVAMNLTAVNPTASSFVQVYPADVTRPTEGSNLNVTAGQAPVPNKVDVKLSSTGKIAVYNNTGTVDAIADIVGYYKSSTISDLENRLAAAEAALASNNLTLTSVDSRLTAAESRLNAQAADIDALEDNVIFTFVNANGTSFAPRRIVATDQVSTGRYSVTVDRITEGCIPSATPFDLETIVAVDGFDRTGSTLFIDTQDLNGTAVNRAFWFFIVCTP